MRKTKMMLLGVLLACSSGAWAASGEGIQKYELDGVTADFKQFHIGDTVPPLYLTPEYNIKQWQQRNPQFTLLDEIKKFQRFLFS